MMEKRLSEDVKEALKAGNKTRVSTLRLLISEIKNRKIDLRGEELTDDDIISVIQKFAGQRKESIDQFKLGGRNDLAEKESEELSILEEYLPEQLSMEELTAIIDGVISGAGTVSMKDMGAVMKDVISKARGRADGGRISEIVKGKLSAG